MSAESDTTTLHEVRVPLRHADFDRLDHLNNIAYLRLIDEAMSQVEDGLPKPRRRALHRDRASTHDIAYLAPVPRGTRDLTVTCYVTTGSSANVEFEIGPRTGSICARARVEHTASSDAKPELLPTAGPHALGTHHLRVQPRVGDGDADGFVTTTAQLELAQEGRLALVEDVTRSHQRPTIVVARSYTRHLRPLRMTEGPPVVVSALRYGGGRSVVFDSEIRIGDTVHTTVLIRTVLIDPATARPAMPDERLRRLLTAYSRGSTDLKAFPSAWLDPEGSSDPHRLGSPGAPP